MTDVHLLPVSATGPHDSSEAPVVRRYPVTFTGTAGEYFRIWIVNVALTLLTLGIYLPWARIRTRQYFYGHTWVDGHNFEYRANPLALLRGYLLVGSLFVAYPVSFQFGRTVWLGVALLLVYVGLYPYLVQQSLRFQAANTAHRGLTFSFHGSPGEAYVAYGAANLASGLVSMALPWAWFMQRRYQVDHLAYGDARGRFRGDVGPFFLIGVKGAALFIGGVAAALALAAVIGGVFVGLSSWLPDPGRLDPADHWATLPVLLAAAYVLAVGLYVVAWQYVRAAVMQFVLNHSELGGVVRATASFSPWRLTWIALTSSAATVMTLGLAGPWAAVRRARYVLHGIEVRTLTGLDSFRGSQERPGSAVGEAATELLDIQVGF